MSKIKLGLSTVFMLMLLGMFAAVASAATVDPNFTPTSTNPAPNIHSADVNNAGLYGTQRTHGNFQNNTNACSNCHSTHNGQNEMLLMKEGDKDLCLSCHDGTMGFYNVESPSGAGVFDFDTNGHTSVSMHNVSADIQIGTAPGAYKNTSTAELECSSCHNPHGSANDRLLTEKVNGATFATSIVGGVPTAVPTGNSTIKLKLTEDPNFAAVNAATGPNGVKITTSAGPVTTATYGGQYGDVYYSQFCGACHDDYFGKRNTGTSTNPAPGKASASDATVPASYGHNNLTYGKYSHTTNSDKQGRNCAACHYAHGTDADQTMMDALGMKATDYVTNKSWTSQQAADYMKDVTPGGSALKKFTNKAVCFACHGTSISTTLDPSILGGDGKILGRSKIVGN